MKKKGDSKSEDKLCGRSMMEMVCAKKICITRAYTDKQLESVEVTDQMEKVTERMAKIT